MNLRKRAKAAHKRAADRGTRRSTEAKRLAKAMAFATKKHRGQFRIGGLPYITHPLAVATMLRAQGYDVEHQIAALFHDLLEDTDATEGQIERLGGPRVRHAVVLLTKQKGYVMADYVARIRQDPMALAVKAADRLHNLRCAVAASEAFRRRYIEESLAWYSDFSPEIPEAIAQLARLSGSAQNGSLS